MLTVSKLIAPASGFACLAWLSLWSWWLSKEYSSFDTAPGGTAVTYHLQDGNFSYSGKSAYAFTLSDAVPIVAKDDVVFFKDVAAYLTSHPARILTLTGHFSIEEKNGTAFKNLGIARAAALKTLLTSAGAPATNIEIAGNSSASAVMEGDKLLGAVGFVFSEKAEEIPAPEQLPAPARNEKIWRTISYVQGGYGLNNAGVNPKPMLDSLRNILRAAGHKKVIINGYSEKTEESKLPGNLAEKRAKAVRRYLVDAGVRRDQIEVKFTMQNEDNGAHSIVELVVE
jgi:outer membrane protein OmpA-like peptidoglycan-associated protein